MPLACPDSPQQRVHSPVFEEVVARARGQRLAVVFPFIHRQADRLFSSIKSWSRFSTCRLSSGSMASGAQVSILFYYDQTLRDAPLMDDGATVQDFFRDSWAKLDPSITKSASASFAFLISVDF